MIEKKSAQQRREHTQNSLQKSDITQKIVDRHFYPRPWKQSNQIFVISNKITSSIEN